MAYKALQANNLPLYGAMAVPHSGFPQIFPWRFRSIHTLRCNDK